MGRLCSPRNSLSLKRKMTKEGPWQLPRQGRVSISIVSSTCKSIDLNSLSLTVVKGLETEPFLVTVMNAQRRFPSCRQVSAGSTWLQADVRSILVPFHISPRFLFLPDMPQKSSWQNLPKCFVDLPLWVRKRHRWLFLFRQWKTKKQAITVAFPRVLI